MNTPKLYRLTNGLDRGERCGWMRDIEHEHDGQGDIDDEKILWVKASAYDTNTGLLRQTLKELRDAAMNTPALDSSSDWTALIEKADAILAHTETLRNPDPKP